MSYKAKIMTNVKKCINKSKPRNTNKDYNFSQLKWHQYELSSFNINESGRL